MHGKFLELLRDFGTAVCVAVEAAAPNPSLYPEPVIEPTPIVQMVTLAHRCPSAEASKLLWEDRLEKSRNIPLVGTYKQAALNGSIAAGALQPKVHFPSFGLA